MITCCIYRVTADCRVWWETRYDLWCYWSISSRYDFTCRILWSGVSLRNTCAYVNIPNAILSILIWEICQTDPTPSYARFCKRSRYYHISRTDRTVQGRGVMDWMNGARYHGLTHNPHYGYHTLSAEVHESTTIWTRSYRICNALSYVYPRARGCAYRIVVPG